MLSEKIEFTTNCQSRQVVAYLKQSKYDVYLSGLLIKVNASLQEVIALKLILS